MSGQAGPDRTDRGRGRRTGPVDLPERFWTGDQHRQQGPDGRGDHPWTDAVGSDEPVEFDRIGHQRDDLPARRGRQHRAGLRRRGDPRRREQDDRRRLLPPARVRTLERATDPGHRRLQRRGDGRRERRLGHLRDHRLARVRHHLRGETDDRRDARRARHEHRLPPLRRPRRRRGDPLYGRLPRRARTRRSERECVPPQRL